MLLIDAPFTFTITAGQATIAVALLTVAGMLWRAIARIDQVLTEHNLMWLDYAERKGIPVELYYRPRGRRRIVKPPISE